MEIAYTEPELCYFRQASVNVARNAGFSKQIIKVWFSEILKKKVRMDVFFYVFFLFETLAIVLAMSTQSHAKRSGQTQAYFQKILKYGGKTRHMNACKYF